MSLENVFNSLNYGINSINKVVVKISTTPAATMKAFLLINVGFEVVDLFHARPLQKRIITDITKGYCEFLVFYSSFKNLIFWINPLSKSTIDQKELEQSLKKELKKCNTDLKVKKILKNISEERAYFSKKELRNKITCFLSSNSELEEEQINKIANNIIIRKKSRSNFQFITTTCSTVVTFGNNALTLQKWNLVNLAKITEVVGKKVPVFLLNFGLLSYVKTFDIIGTTLTAGNATYRLIIIGWNRFQCQEKEGESEEIRSATLDLLSSGTELLAVGIPCFLTLNPPMILFLSALTKGTGLTCVLAR